jgi:hypothetical protein
MTPIVFGNACDDAGNVLTQKLMWKNRGTGQILKNGADPDDTLGVKNVSSTKGDCTLGANYLFMMSPLYMTLEREIPTSLLIEW